ncbi:YajG family lipoprotein [Endozoicomonas sp. Mp262]|uniref:YajG family lipoprotein n=1 Tax=Endozoicomonas sp. Mp262 TaxID=2919499 RepID=UPI0021DF85C6
MRITWAFFWLLTVLLAGCALSPQEIEVSPKLTVPAAARNLSGTVRVSVIDGRDSKTLGARGGVYSDTNPIITDQDFELSVRAAVELALRQMGLVVTDAAEVPLVQVYIDKLTYQVPDGSYVTSVNLEAATKIVVEANGQRFEGYYTSMLDEKVMKAPSDSHNTKLVNRTLSDVLGKALADPGLRSFLEGLRD